MSHSSTIERPGRVLVPAVAEALTDRDLLGRFVDGRDEAAFDALVRRHGPDVLRICRHRLPEAEAEDAFQATFLALVSHAGRIRDADSLGAWLRSVARRVAGRARLRAARRRGRERTDVAIHAYPDRDPGPSDDLPHILRDEVARLPEKYRSAVELCCWQGLSCEQAAGRLDCATGTVKWRLSRAREILRGRLDRLGLAVAVLLSWLVASGSASARTVPGPIRPRGSRPRELPPGAGPSDHLVRRAIDLAARFRDASATAAPVPIAGSRSRRGRRRGWAHHAGLSAIVLIVFAAAAMLLPPFRRLMATAVAGDCPPSETSCH